MLFLKIVCWFKLKLK